jgi:hypothetical protein
MGSMKTHVAVRLSDETIARIDALIPRYSAPWHRATRSDILRALVLEALEHTERSGGLALAPRPARRRRS